MHAPPNDQTGDPFHQHPDENSLGRDVLDPIFKAGVEARGAGLTLDRNPHAAGTEERREWEAGWKATVEIEDEDDGPAGTTGLA